jgi:HEPN domain-containing protein
VQKIKSTYIETRYPTEIVYTKAIAKEAFENASLVVKWAKRKLKK